MKTNALLLLSASLLANANAQTCPPVPAGQDQKYKAWFIDKETGAELRNGGILPVNTRVLWHGKAEAYGHCDVYVLDGPSQQCVWSSRQEHVVAKIDRWFNDPSGYLQLNHNTYGIYPSGGTAFWHVLDSTDTATSTGPAEEMLGYVGPYQFFSENDMLTTACNMQPESLQAPRFTLHARKPRVCPKAGAELAKFANPCDVVNGTKSQVETDLAVGPLQVHRYYHSAASQFDVGLGYGWGSGLTRRVERGGLKLNVVEADGSGDVFTLSNGVWTGSSGTKYTVTSVGDDYVVKSKAGRIDRFGKAGNLLESTDLFGRTTTYQYDENGRLIRVQDAFGRGLDVAYAGERVSAIVIAPNQTIGYQYGADGTLASVTYADGSQRSYGYDVRQTAQHFDAALLTGIVDESGTQFAVWGYDANRKVTSSAHAPGAAGGPVDNFQFSYAGSDYSGTNTALDPLGVTWTLTYGNAAGTKVLTQRTNSANNSTLSQAFDSYGNRTSLTNEAGVRTCFAYDTTRQVETYRVEGIPSTVTTGCLYLAQYANPLPVGSRRTVTAWHPGWDLPIKTSQPGKITTRVYNGQPDPFNGNATASCAPASALLPDGTPIVVLCKEVEQATTDVDGRLGFGATLQSGVTPRQQNWTYNEYGQVLTADGPRIDVNDVTTYGYYADTDADHTRGDLQSVTNPLGQTTQYTKYSAHGQVLRTVDANGVVTENTFDLRQRPVSVTVGGQATSYEYWPTGQLKRLTQPDGSYVQYTYDSAQRLIALSDNRGNSIAYTLDVAGNRTGEQIKDPGGLLTRQLARSFDALGRTQQVIGRE